MQCFISIFTDVQVLRFYCVWDDRSSMFGEKRPYIIQYYLVDDTVEVREVHESNDGHDPFPVFLRRQKLPKNRYNVECELIDSDLFAYC